MDSHSSYLDRKHREILLLDRCLSTPLNPARPDSIAGAIELKFLLAALVKADRVARCGPVTETARPPSTWRSTGRFAFSYGYQRADLEVRGPSIYPAVQRLGDGWRASTVYTGSGMSAIAVLLLAALQLDDTIDIVAPIDCYAETRELMRSLGARIHQWPWYPGPGGIDATARVLWLDSSTRAPFNASLAGIAQRHDLVVLDTTCFSRRSSKIAKTVRRALTMGVPIALVRSHAKLDCLGVEYGRLGSLVVMAPDRITGMTPSSWTGDLVPKIRDAVRLLGAAPVLGSFPPFEGSAEYDACSTARIASIARATRRLARALELRLPTPPTTFQHGLYLTITARNGASADEVKLAASEMAAETAAQGLPVKHAGSFGFDFVAVERCADAIDGSNSLRICGADLPLALADEIGHRIANWCLRHRWSTPGYTASMRSCGAAALAA